MTTIDSVLRRALDDRSGDLILTLDPGFQGLPDTAHGGSVLAAFQALAGVAGPQALHGLYRRRVPLGTPLRVTLARGDDGVTCRLLDATEAVLVEGGVRAAATAAFGAPIGVGGARSATRQRADDPRYWDTDIVAADDAGRVVASGRITFVAVRGAARRLVAGLLAMNPPEMLRRVFPAYIT